jgi:hypothetical protein
MPNRPTQDNDYLAAHAQLLWTSFRHWTGKDLLRDASVNASINASSDTARRLYQAPFAVVSHDTAAVPVFNYGNAKALELFEMEWDTFCRLPSRHSAEPLARDERQSLLDRVSQHGHITDYRGVRISATGRRFLIEGALVWNLIDADFTYRGQAAAFHQWTFL